MLLTRTDTDATTWLAKLLTLHVCAQRHTGGRRALFPDPPILFPAHAFHGEVDGQIARSLPLPHRASREWRRSAACLLPPTDPLTLSVRDGDGTNRNNALGL